MPRVATQGAIEVLRAPPVLTVQDLGRPGWLASGVPYGGAMDPWSLQAANMLVGNERQRAGLEWAEGGGNIRFSADCVFALGGARVHALLDGEHVEQWRQIRATADSELEVGRFQAGRFLYVAVHGGVDAPQILGSRSTCMPAGFGGVHGRRARTGDAFPIGALSHAIPRALQALPSNLFPALGGKMLVRVVAGPQRHLLSDDAWRLFLVQRYGVSTFADRTGYRLEGVPLDTPSGIDMLPSEPVCAGAVQLPSGGLPIVLMSDAPTVGGYIKPAVVCTADLSRLAQRRPGEEVQFAEVTVEEALRAYRERSAWLKEVEAALST